MTQIDFGKTAKDYRTHRAGFPPELITRLQGFGVGKKGQRLLDLGTGTGTLARLFALEGCSVVGTDPAEPLLLQAAELDREVGVTVEYAVGKAEETGLPSGSFDVVTAGTCWHWFDRSKAAAEVSRLLKPSGRVVIAHFDWIPLAGNVAAMTEAQILRYNPTWPLAGGTGLYPAWFADLSGAGFKNLESFTFDVNVTYTHEGWRGRIRASAGVAASLPPEKVAEFDAELRDALAERFPTDPLLIPHRVFALIAERG